MGEPSPDDAVCLILSDTLIGAIERDGIEIDGQTYRI
jgi:hypothetical protein